MKPISRKFGFYTLMSLSAFATFMGDTESGAVFMVGGILFDAIKCIGKP